MDTQNTQKSKHIIPGYPPYTMNGYQLEFEILEYEMDKYKSSTIPFHIETFLLMYFIYYIILWLIYSIPIVSWIIFPIYFLISNIVISCALLSISMIMFNTIKIYKRNETAIKKGKSFYPPMALEFYWKNKSVYIINTLCTIAPHIYSNIPECVLEFYDNILKLKSGMKTITSISSNIIQMSKHVGVYIYNTIKKENKLT